MTIGSSTPVTTSVGSGSIGTGIKTPTATVSLSVGNGGKGTGNVAANGVGGTLDVTA